MGKLLAVRICPRCSSVYAAHVARCGLDNELLVEAPQDPLIGKTIDRYQIVERLGTGGMGCVYRATHTIIDREYAIKVLYGDFACDEKFRTRFQREAQSISKIRHPNVVTVEDFGTSATGLTFLAMEMVRGKTLEEVIEKEAPISPTRTAHLIRQIAAGLGAAHRLGFVHRDVKPANVMLTKVDGIEWVKILDFGAVNLRSVPLDQRLTSIGHIIGTPTYMAPEQTQDPNVAPTADLYALGVIMHEMLTGQPPFVGSGRAEVLVKHITEAPPPTPPSRGLESLTQKLLKKHPGDRPQTTDEVIQAIDRLNLGLQAVPIPPSNTAGQMAKPPVSLSGMTQPLAVVEMAKGKAVPKPAEPERTNFDTFPSLGVADPAEQEQAWSGWAEASLEAASYSDVASIDGPPRYPALNLKLPSTEDSPSQAANTDPTQVEPQTPSMRDTTDPRFGMPEIRDSNDGPPGESTDVAIKGLVNRGVALPKKTNSEEGLLYEQPLEGAPRPAADDGGPTQVDFRVNFEELGLRGPGNDDTVPLPKAILPKAVLPELQSFSDQPISPDRPLGTHRLEAPPRPRPDLDTDPESSGFETSRTVLDPALIEESGNFAVRPVPDVDDEPPRATMKDTLLPDTKVPLMDDYSPAQGFERYLGVKTPPPLMPLEELPAVPSLVQPHNPRRIALYAALIFALLVVIGLIGTAYLRAQPTPTEIAPQVSIQK